MHRALLWLRLSTGRRRLSSLSPSSCFRLYLTVLECRIRQPSAPS